MQHFSSWGQFHGNDKMIFEDVACDFYFISCKQLNIIYEKYSLLTLYVMKRKQNKLCQHETNERPYFVTAQRGKTALGMLDISCHSSKDYWIFCSFLFIFLGFYLKENLLFEDFISFL